MAPACLPKEFRRQGKRLAAALQSCVRTTDPPMLPSWLVRSNQRPLRGPSPLRRTLDTIVDFLTQ
eukprot:4790862-Pyramimonas_sp.AAC.1